METRQICEYIHQYANNAERDIGWWLGKLAEKKDNGWHPESLPIMRMRGDAERLQYLVTLIMRQTEEMICGARRPR